MSEVNKRYLIAVSGGPDSMALLDMFANSNNYIEVAHVNYHKRPTAIRDENIVKDYCLKHHLIFNKADYIGDNKGNFQASARIFRYKYFYEVCKKHNLDAVMVAHHKDDHIETYYMQKDMGVNYYGLKKEIVLYGVKVIRPLLDYTKDDLLKYCDEHNIDYGIDESNLSDDYTRNKIRHTIIDKLSIEEKNKIVKEINDRNVLQINDINNSLSYLNESNSYDFIYFMHIPNLINILRFYFPNKSNKYYEEVIRQLKSSEYLVINNDDKYLVKEYDLINIFDKPKAYEFVFNSFKDIKMKDYEHFKLSDSGSSRQGVTISDDDFPIRIRNVKKDDYIKMMYGKKKLNRFFIDNKISLKERMNYPVVLNKNDDVILVTNLGCDINHYSINHNLYVLK